MTCDTDHTAEIMDTSCHALTASEAACTTSARRTRTRRCFWATEPSPITVPGARCPPGTYYRKLDFKLSPELNKHIGNGELLGTMQLESGNKVVACHAYFMVLYSKRPTAKEWY
ncbi:hypothetical protein MTO96_023131 [Rhipicephalus appendiculatus]